MNKRGWGDRPGQKRGRSGCIERSCPRPRYQLGDQNKTTAARGGGVSSGLGRYAGRCRSRLRTHVPRARVFACFAVLCVLLGVRTQAQGQLLPGEVVDPPLDYLTMIGVCPVPSDGKEWSVMWHPAVPTLPAREQQRIWKALEGPDIDACLELLVLTDPVAGPLVSTISPESKDPGLAGRVRRAVSERWRLAGVARAFEEVAQTGKRGSATAALLEACAKLRKKAPVLQKRHPNSTGEAVP